MRHLALSLLLLLLLSPVTWAHASALTGGPSKGPRPAVPLEAAPAVPPRPPQPPKPPQLPQDVKPAPQPSPARLPHLLPTEVEPWPLLRSDLALEARNGAPLEIPSGGPSEDSALQPKLPPLTPLSEPLVEAPPRPLSELSEQDQREEHQPGPRPKPPALLPQLPSDFAPQVPQSLQPPVAPGADATLLSELMGGQVPPLLPGRVGESVESVQSLPDTYPPQIGDPHADAHQATEAPVRLPPPLPEQFAEFVLAKYQFPAQKAAAGDRLRRALPEEVVGGDSVGPAVPAPLPGQVTELGPALQPPPYQTTPQPPKPPPPPLQQPPEQTPRQPAEPLSQEPPKLPVEVQALQGPPQQLSQQPAQQPAQGLPQRPAQQPPPDSSEPPSQAPPKLPLEVQVLKQPPADPSEQPLPQPLAQLPQPLPEGPHPVFTARAPGAGEPAVPRQPPGQTPLAPAAQPAPTPAAVAGGSAAVSPPAPGPSHGPVAFPAACFSRLSTAGCGAAYNPPWGPR